MSSGDHIPPADATAARACIAAGVASTAGEGAPTAAEAPVLDYEAPPTSTLGRRATAGFFWLTLQIIFTKGLALIAQIVLAWHLIPEEFGQASIALMLGTLIGMIRDAGVSQVLVQRRTTDAELLNAGFWMGLTISLIAAVLILIATPITERLMPDVGQIRHLTPILAIASPLQALCLVPAIILHVNMQFRALAVINTITAVTGGSLSILFAMWGFGAYSLILPAPIVALVRAIAMFVYARPRPRIRANPGLRLWLPLAIDSGLVMSSYVFATVISQADYLILGYLTDKLTVGFYFFAFVLSMQTTQLLVANVATVMLPAFTHVQDNAERQKGAFLEATRLIAAVGVPVGLCQAVVAGPLIRLVFDAGKWGPAIPIFQLLSIAMAIGTVSVNAVTVMQAQARYRALVKLQAASACLFVIAVTLGTLAAVRHGNELSGSIGAAVALVVYYALAGPVWLYVAMRPLGGTLLDAVRLHAVPLTTAAVAFGIAAVLAHLVPGGETTLGDLMRLLVSIGSGGLIYAILLRLISPGTWEAMTRRLAGLLRFPRRVPTDSTSATTPTPGVLS